MSSHDKRIETLRQTISASEQKINELQTQRTAALASDDDALIDSIDSELDALRKRITLSNERITVAEQAAQEEAAQAEQDRLDAVAARADKARKVGESLLPEYAGAATKLSALLGRLTAIDALIAESNHTLRIAGRETIASPNAIRCRPMSYVERTERRRVGIGEAQHPMHGKVTFDLNNNAYDAKGEMVPTFGEFDVTVRDVVPMINNEPLQTAVQLPAATVDGAPIWPRPAHADTAAVLRELGLADAVPSVLKRVMSKVA